jgi:hypothetical protein
MVRVSIRPGATSTNSSSSLNSDDVRQSWKVTRLGVGIGRAVAGRSSLRAQRHKQNDATLTGSGAVTSAVRTGTGTLVSVAASASGTGAGLSWGTGVLSTPVSAWLARSASRQVVARLPRHRPRWLVAASKSSSWQRQPHSPSPSRWQRRVVVTRRRRSPDLR